MLIPRRINAGLEVMEKKKNIIFVQVDPMFSKATIKMRTVKIIDIVK
jgi:hypothetical protein